MKNTEAEQAVAERVGRDTLALPDDHAEPDHREDEEQPRVRDSVDGTFDETHYRSSQSRI
jgi:hypothetical protein